MHTLSLGIQANDSHEEEEEEHEHENYDDELEVLRVIEDEQKRQEQQPDRVHSDTANRRGKRRLEEISDSNENDVEVVTSFKKRRMEQRTALSPLGKEEKHKASLLSDGQIYKNLPPMGENYVTVTSSNGKRLYVTLKDDDDDEEAERGAIQKESVRDSLINKQQQQQQQQHALGTNTILASGKTIEQLLDNVDKRKMLSEIEKKVNEATKDTNVNDSSSKEKQHNVDEKERQQALFVDKYAPSSFTHLLTNEKYNREALRWVKEWDPIVFKRDAPSASTSQAPFFKIMLLAGSPGIGKTSLAHMIARQAGYEPQEINASDDRSPAKMLEHLEAAGTRSIKNFHRPKLLIFDEIDGAMAATEGKSSIDMLLKVCYPPASARSSSKKGDSSNSKKKNSKKGRNRTSTARGGGRRNALPKQIAPIICICNDLYSPVLRELRKKSKVLLFQRHHTQSERIVERLQHVCNVEGLDIPVNILNKLVAHCDADIRSSLNTLQFLKDQLASGKKKQKISDNLSSLVAQKDMKREYFDLLNKVFSSIPTVARGKSSTASRLNILHTLLSSEFGSERILNGCYENYPLLVSDHSDSFKVLDWTGFSDQMQRMIGRTQDHSLLSYSIFSVINYNLICGTQLRKPQFSYPRKDFEMKTLHRQNRHIVQTQLSGCIPQVARMYSVKDAALDLVPNLICIINPKVHNHHEQLVANGDLMKRLVNIHIEYGLAYANVFTEGQSRLKIDPDIMSLVDKFIFQSPDARLNELNITLKRSINHEIGMEKIRRMADNDSVSKKEEASVLNSTRREQHSSASSPQRIKHSVLRPENCAIHYRYNEGMTNAIRRPARITEFV